jgi:bifunctional DNA-binding transcriptional regulator/antitoxin component of YhaV-PrlF toxin-antitoxin module
MLKRLDEEARMAKRKSTRGLSERETPYRHRQEKRKPVLRRQVPPATLPDGTVRFVLTLGPKGRVLLPAEMRAAMGLGKGDVITAWLKDGELTMHSHRHGLEKIREAARAMLKRNILASDELIAERRAENAKEEEKPRHRKDPA